MRLVDIEPIVELVKGEHEKVQNCFNEADISKEPNDVALWGAVLQEVGAFIGLMINAPTVDVFGCWIPVTERLPDATGLYLVSCYQVYDYVTISTFELYEDGSYWTEIGVEAWMPIPDPYKGEKK